METLWNIHWEYNSDMVVDLCFAAKNVTILVESIEFSIEKENGFKYVISKRTNVYVLVASNIDDLFI